jgi:hypothetical protein
MLYIYVSGFSGRTVSGEMIFEGMTKNKLLSKDKLNSDILFLLS